MKVTCLQSSAACMLIVTDVMPISSLDDGSHIWMVSNFAVVTAPVPAAVAMKKATCGSPVAGLGRKMTL